MVGDVGPRIGPVPPEAWDDQVRQALERAGMAHVPPESLPNAVTTLLRHPRLAGGFLRYNMGLLVRPALLPRWRELMILRVAWRAGGTYEWLQHAVAAGLNDVSPEEVAAVADGGLDHQWGPVEAALLSATDQLLDHYLIDDDTWSRLAEHLDPLQLFEVPFVVGTYACLAMVFNSFGIELDPDLEEAAASGLPVPEPPRGDG